MTSSFVVQNYLVRNNTDQEFPKDDLECFLSLIASLEDTTCKDGCMNKVMSFNNLLAGSDIRVQVDTENHQLHINYMRALAE